MSAVPTIKPHLSSIKCPDQLAALEGWLIWRYEPNGEKKPRKVPYYVSGGKRHGVHGRPEDRANLTTFSAARAAAARRGFDGVGLALMPEFNIVALDFDDCLKGGTLNPEVEAIAAQSYAEYSPSGKGVRAFFTGAVGNRKDNDSPEYGFETFSSKGFVTFSGNRLEIVDVIGNDNSINALTAEVNDLCAKRFGQRDQKEATAVDTTPVGLTAGQLDECLSVLPTDMSYDDWLTVGMALHHEFQGSDDGFNLWDEWSQNSPKYSSREYGWERWVSFGRYSDKPVTARSLVRLANENGAHINLNGPASLEDFEDLAQHEDVEFSDVSDDAPASEATGKPARFGLVPVHDFSQGAHPGWIIKNVLPKAELAVVYGESGSGKSFAVLDMVAAVARGVPWRGNRVKKGRVVYIAAEGAGGFRKRLIAYAARQGISLEEVEMFVIPNAPNLLTKEDALEVSKEIVKTIGRADIVVVDTLAQTTPGGNENAGEDMGKALAHCKGLHRATGALILLVHHSGKDSSKGARGWSGLKAACDAEFEVSRLPMGRMLRNSKQKDGDDSAAWGFDLDIVDIGTDEDGDVVTSCVIRETEVNLARATEMPKWKGNDALLVKVIEEMAEFQTAGIELEEVKKETARRLVEQGLTPKDARDVARRSLKKVCNHESSPYEVDEDGSTLSVV